MSALVDLWPAYVAYAVSFMLIGAIWINHHAMLAKFQVVDGVVLILNLFQLMIVAFLPFSTAVLASAFLNASDEGVAAAFYGATLAVGGVFVNLLWWYGVRARLLRPTVTPAGIRRATWRFGMAPVMYAIAAAIGFVVPAAALLVYVCLIAFYLLWPALGHRLQDAAADD